MTNTIASLLALRSSASSSRIDACTETSSAEVISSQSTTAGPATRARARATL